MVLNIELLELPMNKSAQKLHDCYRISLSAVQLPLYLSKGTYYEFLESLGATSKYIKKHQSYTEVFESIPYISAIYCYFKENDEIFYAI